jgi:beta-glucosidase
MKRFYWGASTSAYQIEGAHLDEGRGLSIWDVFSSKKGKIEDGTNGNISCDHYNRYIEDVEIMKSMNLNSYRFSISWPRIMPSGKGEINQRGLDFYDRLVDELLSKGITPFATLYHFDLPYELHRQGGWYKRDTAKYFADYTEVVVRRLSDRVKNWITINEPLTMSSLGYYTGHHAPGNRNFLKGPQVVHNTLLAHGYAMERIKGEDKSSRAGLTNILYPVHPFSEKDNKAVKRANDLNRIFMDPIFMGKYPDSSRLFTPDDKLIKEGDMKIISHPMDFIGINVYSRTIVKNLPVPPGFRPVKPSYDGAKFTAMGWEIYPKAIYEALKWTQENYNNPEILITENGAAFEDKLLHGKVFDRERLKFLKDNLYYVGKAAKEGVKVKGYFAWSLLDNFEWSFGLAKRFGLVYVDYKTGNRYIKNSGLWYSSICKRGELGLESIEAPEIFTGDELAFDDATTVTI